MLKRLSIALAQINTSENVITESGKSHILCIEQKKLLKKYATMQWTQ